MSKWNGWVKCVKTDSNYFTLNKEYQIVDNNIIRDDGYAVSAYGNIISLNATYSSKFDELCVPSPRKDLLKSGDRIILKGGKELYVLVETNSVHHLNGHKYNNLSASTLTIEQIWRGEILIAKHEEVDEKYLALQEKSEELKSALDEVLNELKDYKHK